MNTEVKNILQLLALILPLFAVMVVGWLNSPMYDGVKANERREAQILLLAQTYHTNASVNREALVEKYHFTEEELDLSLLWQQFVTDRQ